ncbi:DUF6894 family protein [Methylobacterium nodulans]|uniref:DUF6894 domain-containing protein n=1 Tax=Methylobacterium nodulans (strain LMG 21967 / CNCM I-2342 / ORS 2060) TaxID=460265 RepID=B8IK48_METNO|nr:hypothetical protein [Methylobacterium nodulans]ACL60061.1 conserved hypothetical protein [Methylobacterium nodulans ORS 2060]
MATYRFHCTNGLECLLDAEGQRVRPGESIRRRAAQVAEGVRRRFGGDWSDWSVTVHDLEGRQVLLLPFGAEAAGMALAA